MDEKKQQSKDVVLGDLEFDLSDVRILIIDDEVHLVENLQTILTDQGFSVDISHEGNDGIEKLKQDNYHLVITDMVMPEVDGYSVMEYVKKNKPETLLIVITGYASTESAVNAMRKGAYQGRKRYRERTRR